MKNAIHKPNHFEIFSMRRNRMNNIYNSETKCVLEEEKKEHNGGFLLFVLSSLTCFWQYDFWNRYKRASFTPCTSDLFAL